MTAKKIIFHKQETCWTCGPAVMRMALEGMGIKKSEKQLARILKTNKIRGTWPKDLPRIAEKYSLNYAIKRNATIEDLKYFKKQGYFIIICYYIPKDKVDHYSILKKIDSEYIYFYDPWFGPDHKYSLKYFLKIWKSDPKYENTKRWFIALNNSK